MVVQMVIRSNRSCRKRRLAGWLVGWLGASLGLAGAYAESKWILYMLEPKRPSSKQPKFKCLGAWWGSLAVRESVRGASDSSAGGRSELCGRELSGKQSTTAQLWLETKRSVVAAITEPCRCGAIAIR